MDDLSKWAGIGTTFASPRQNFSNTIPVFDLNISKLPTQTITILLYHNPAVSQVFLLPTLPQKGFCSFTSAPTEHSTGPGVFQRNSTETFTHSKSRPKCYLQAGSIFSRWHKTDDGTSSQMGTETLQRNFPVVTLSPFSNFAHFGSCALPGICCLPHLWGFTCILETTPSTWNRNPPKLPAALLSIFQSVLRLSSFTLQI